MKHLKFNLTISGDVWPGENAGKGHQPLSVEDLKSLLYDVAEKVVATEFGSLKAGAALDNYLCGVEVH